MQKKREKKTTTWMHTKKNKMADAVQDINNIGLKCVTTFCGSGALEQRTKRHAHVLLQQRKRAIARVGLRSARAAVSFERDCHLPDRKNGGKWFFFLGWRVGGGGGVNKCPTKQ